MTPAQLNSLLTTHARINDPKRRSKPAPEQGSVADLMAFANMRRVG